MINNVDFSENPDKICNQISDAILEQAYEKAKGSA